MRQQPINRGQKKSSRQLNAGPISSLQYQLANNQTSCSMPLLDVPTARQRSGRRDRCTNPWYMKTLFPDSGIARAPLAGFQSAA